MTAYIIRRLLYTIPIVFGVALVGFTLFHLVGGDPVILMMGKHGNLELMEELRRELGLDRPFYLQFVDYLKQIVTFDFGQSYATKQSVRDMIFQGIGPSFTLAVTAFSMSLVFGIIISLVVAYFRGKLIDRMVVVFCVMGMSVTSLAYILFGQYFFAYKLELFPISGYENSFPERMNYIIMPALIWVMVSLGIDVRFFRTAILDETYQDYVRTARAKGLDERKVFFKHILKNSLVPIITYVVIQIPFLILGSLLLENFFSIPGLGSITVEAFNNSDWPVLKAMLPALSIMFMIGQLVSDILYTVVDPRVVLR